jgi:hypothetical protein
MMTARSYCGYIRLLRRMGKTSLVTSVKDVFIKDLEGQIKTSVYMIKSVYMMYVRDQIFISYLGVDFKDEDKAKVLIYLVSVRFMFIFYRSSRLPISRHFRANFTSFSRQFTSFSRQFHTSFSGQFTSFSRHFTSFSRHFTSFCRHFYVVCDVRVNRGLAQLRKDF